ncbi:MAG: CbiX/SirB N-terminal domain-containing protein [Zoogloeaceae bacterium]|nr:CbiX/SirB N-terminal domain-containing protein [Zoogloeaceae bacterium]
MEIKSAVVLFGHGARDPEWARPMQRARGLLLESEPGLAVELAFLEFMQPTLAEAIDRLVADGVGRVTVVPVFLAQGGHLKKDVPVLVEEARVRHPQCEIRQVLAVGEADTVVAAIAGYAAQCGRG